jgi:hypothetical protein
MFLLMQTLLLTRRPVQQFEPCQCRAVGKLDDGSLAAVIAAASIWGIVGNTVSMECRARFGPQALNADSHFAVLGMVCALCAWGILRWRPWGHALALGIFSFEFFVGALALFAGDSGPFYPFVACLVLSWLLLPSVRPAFWRRV